MNYHEDPRIHVGVTRRVKLRDGSHVDFTVNLSGIPITASESSIDMMMGKAQIGFGAILAEMEERARAVLAPQMDPTAFFPVHTQTAVPAPEDPRAASPILPSESAGDPDDAPLSDLQRPCAAGDLSTAPAPAGIDAAFVNLVEEMISKCKPVADLDWDDAYNRGEVVVPVENRAQIPDERDVRMFGTVFGVEIPLPPYDWLSEPISKTGGEGDGGQCKALNSALTAAGYGGKARHPATLAILRAYGAIHDHAPREGLSSISDLSKAEAHIALSWFDLAGPEAIAQLAAAVRGVR